MTKQEYIDLQIKERKEILKNILESKDKKKLIVAGAGTGKTFTFSEILKKNLDGTNIAMTFIRLLRDEMLSSLGPFSEVRTFHEFCKKVLHERKGGFILFPRLSDVIKEDSNYLNVTYNNFDHKFQNLDETGNGIEFFLKRGDYYNAVSFNDSVYRMLKELQKDSDIISDFDQILIDEFQDFNPLEVAFIDELEKKGDILIVGDDDQAVYETRFSTPEHLRTKYYSGNYKTFELPFCNRCTKTIVNATNGFINEIQKCGGLKNRIQKRYECFIAAKDLDNKKHPKVITAQLTNIHTVSKFIKNEISKILQEDIEESWEVGKEYPTILIVGARQYLNPIYKSLKNGFENISFKQYENNEISICDGYNILLQNVKSNLGWRIVINFIFKNDEIKKIIGETTNSKPIIDIISKEVVESQMNIISIIAKLKKEEENNEPILNELKKVIAQDIFEEINRYFILTEKTEKIVDKTRPSVLLTSFQGCKGLSAGFVFIVGANNGVIPRNTSDVSDVEISQFIVALTRTRKKCYILSEERMYSPKDDKGNWIPKNVRSSFINLIPSSELDDLGKIKASMIK